MENWCRVAYLHAPALLQTYLHFTSVWVLRRAMRGFFEGTTNTICIHITVGFCLTLHPNQVWLIHTCQTAVHVTSMWLSYPFLPSVTKLTSTIKNINQVGLEDVERVSEQPGAVVHPWNRLLTRSHTKVSFFYILSIRSFFFFWKLLFYSLKHKKCCRVGVKLCSASYHLTNFCGWLRCQARLALSQPDRNLSTVCSGKGPYDMAQCHDCLDIKMDVETNPECSYINSTCHLLTDSAGSSLSGITLHALGGCQTK